MTLLDNVFTGTVMTSLPNLGILTHVMTSFPTKITWPNISIPYVAKFSRPKIFANRFQKGGQKYSRQKYSRRGGSDTLRNTQTWLLCVVWLVGSLTVDEPSQYYTPSRVYSASLADTWQYSANILQEQRVSSKKVQAQLAWIVIA